MAGLFHALTIAGYLDEEPSCPFKMLPQEVIEGEHVLLFAELNMVGNVLQDLRHEHQPSLHLSTRLTVQDASLTGGNCNSTSNIELKQLAILKTKDMMKMKDKSRSTCNYINN